MDFSKVKNFSELLKTIVNSKGKCSVGNSVLKILELCKNSKNREELSMKITKIIKESKTEQEVMEKLRNLK